MNRILVSNKLSGIIVNRIVSVKSDFNDSFLLNKFWIYDIETIKQYMCHYETHCPAYKRAHYVIGYI